MIKTDLMTHSYPDKTQKRKYRLAQYVQANLLSSDNAFICSRFQGCSDSRKESWFYKGQMSQVGKHYDLEVDGRPMRIVRWWVRSTGRRTRVSVSAGVRQ